MFWMFTQTRHNCKLTWVKYQISQQSSGPDNFPQSSVECSGPCLCFYLQPLERKQQRAFSFFFRYFRWQGETVNWKSTFCANLHFQLQSPITPVTGEEKANCESRHVWKHPDNGNGQPFAILFPPKPTSTPGNLHPLLGSSDWCINPIIVVS